MPIKRGIPRIIIIICAALVIVALSYYLFYMPKCKDITCFKESLWKCNKASFVNERANSTWLYKVEGFTSDTCKVYVKSIFLKTDAATANALQGKEMECLIPKNILGSFMPEEKIEFCHGILKEEIQRLIIENMNSYIAQNIGQINEAAVTPI